MDIAVAIAGLAILIVAGDLLVRGAVGLSIRFGVPKLIVGLTVVSIGTSLPELLVSIDAVLSGAPSIALGNVVGSNITNVLLVLGVPALISTVTPSGSGSTRNYLLVLAASALLILLCFLGPLHLIHAAILLAGLAAVLWDMARSARRDGGQLTGDLDDDQPSSALWKLVAYMLFGMAALPLGASLLIDGATGIARQLGISEAVIGLTLVALGTSLPELATTVMAAIRRQTDVAMGNVLGSNLFDILAILGITSLFGPINVDLEFLARDLWVMLAASLVLAPFVLRDRRMGRRTGAAFLALYAAYYVYLFNAPGTPA